MVLISPGYSQENHPVLHRKTASELFTPLPNMSVFQRSFGEMPTSVWNYLEPSIVVLTYYAGRINCV